MFVTQNRSVFLSDPSCRQSYMCYKKVTARLICMILVAALTVSSMIVPVSAVDPELLYMDILPADGYAKTIDGVRSSSLSVSPTYHFNGVTQAGWTWDARPYEHTFQTIIFTVYSNSSYKLSEADVYFSFYDGRRIKAELVGSEGHYYQYRVNSSSNLSWVTIDAEFSEPYTGNFAIYSCIGIRDIGFSIDSVYWQQWVSMVKSGSSNLVKELVASGQDVSLPVGHISKRTDVYQTWFEDIIYLSGDFGGCSALESLTILGYGFLIDAPTFVIMDARTDVPIYVFDSEDFAARYSTTMGAWGENAWQAYYWQLSVDLSGYDLSDCEWELSFSLDPLTYKSGMSFTDWNVTDVIARLPVSEAPWYQVMWNWISSKWDNYAIRITNALTVTKNQLLVSLGDISEKIDNLIVPSEVQDTLNQAADSIGEKTDKLNDFNTKFDSVDKPEVNSSDLFDPLVGASQFGTAILSSLTSQEIVVRILLAVFTLSFAGYIFFGKR